jgi:hypothetical protein
MFPFTILMAWRMSLRACNVGGRMLLVARIHQAVRFALRRSLPVALLLMPMLAPAAELAPIDALAAATPAPGNPARHFTTGELAAFHGHFDERLGLPTLIIANPGAVRASGASLLVSDPVQVARGYLKGLTQTYRISPAEIDALPIVDAQNLPNGAALVRFGHVVHGIEVFRDGVGVLVNADGALNSIGGSVAGSGPEANAALGLFQRGAEAAIAVALQDFGFDRAAARAALHVSDRRDNYTWYALSGRSPAGAELLQPVRSKPVWFRTPSGLVPAWYAEVAVNDPATRAESRYSYVIGAKDGALLFRHNLVQYDAFAYRVWAEASGRHVPYPGPQGRNGTPSATGVPDGYQAPFVAPNLITLTNAMAPASVGINDPWLAPGASQTLGNNVDAYADLDGIDGFSGSDYRASTTAAGTFDRVYDVSQQPQASVSQVMASITEAFYATNWLHDWYYDAGFDEAAGNAQSNNYGRGGVAGDPMLVETGNNPATDNANMTTPADGSSPRMQIYPFTGAVQAGVALTGALSATYAVGTADYGPLQFDLPGSIVLVNDGTATVTDGCEPIVNNVSLKIALIDRGNCSFEKKTLNAQNAGAIGAIIVNSTDPAIHLPVDNTIVTPITIPSLSVSHTDGTAIKTALGSGAVSAEMTSSHYVGREAAVDNTIVAHEWGHYLSHRLIHNSAGVNSNMAGGENEGFADFNALLMMVESGDSAFGAAGSFSGTYASAGYVADRTTSLSVPENGYYFGLRRYPYSTDLTRNPLTFTYIQDGVALPVGPPASDNSAANSEVHKTGEVWASMLWECYAALLQQPVAFATTQDNMKRYFVAGLKLTPVDATFPEARDALLQAILSQSSGDYQACAAGFAKRGLGIGAVSPDRYDQNSGGLAESFVSNKSAGAFVSAALSDTQAGSCDASDGYLDSLEAGALTFKFYNGGFQPLAAATLSVTSPDAFVTTPVAPLSIPTVAQYTTQTTVVPIQLRGILGSRLLTLNYSVSDAALLAPVAGQAQFIVNVDSVASRTDDFENATLAWTATSSDFIDAAALWSRLDAGSANHVAFGPDVGAPGLTTLVSPTLNVAASGSFSFTFLHRFDFEQSDQNYDGGVIEISTDNGGTWHDVKQAGATLSPDYNGIVFNGSNNPLSGRAAYVGNSGGSFSSVSVNFGNSLQGQAVKLRFVIGSDDSAGAGGWQVDNLAATGITNTPFTRLVADPGHCIPDRVFGYGFQ